MQSCMELLPYMPDVYKPMVLYYFQDACNTDAFVSLPVETLCEILTDDNLAVDNEQTVLDAVKWWLKYNAYDARLHVALHKERERHGMDVDWDRGSDVLVHRGVRAICASSMGMIYAVHEGLRTRTMLLQDSLKMPWTGQVQQMLLLRAQLIIVSDCQLFITNILHETWQPVALPDEAECTCVTAYQPSSHGDAAPHSFVAGYSDGHIGLWRLQEDGEWFCAKVASKVVVYKMVSWQQFVIYFDAALENIFATDVHSGNHIRVNKENVIVCGMVVCHKGLVYTTYQGDLIVHELGGGWTELHAVHLIAPPLRCLVVRGSQIVCGAGIHSEPWVIEKLWVLDIATFELKRREFHGQTDINSLFHWPGVGVCSLGSTGSVALWSRTPISF